MSPKEGLSFDPEFNLGWFKQPGFELLQATWSEILTPDERGRFNMSSTDALDMLAQARKAVRAEHKLSDTQLNQTEKIAFKYASTLPTELLNEAL
ncbi:MAG: hypothetical protein M3Q79_00140 [bacterium]|nr:hypothetical protein [bacterium]